MPGGGFFVCDASRRPLRIVLTDQAELIFCENPVGEDFGQLRQA
jgi:hypothetical protein